jgi:hypothetical protein
LNIRVPTMFLAERLVSVICGHFKGTHEAMNVSKIEQSRREKWLTPFCSGLMH